jgi:Tol biopolymer transport system component
MRTHGESTSAVAATLVAALLLLPLTLTLVACGGSDTTPSSSPAGAASPPGAAASPGAATGSPAAIAVHPGTIVFARLHRAASGDKYDAWTASTDGADLVRLTRGRMAEPTGWSPDGKKILSMVDGQTWVMNADGSHQRQLTDSRLGALWAVFSPDGKRIAFSNNFHTYGDDGLPPAHINVMNADGSGARVVTRGGANDMIPTWGPDGMIYFLRKPQTRSWYSPDGDVYAVRPDGSGLVRVTKMEHVGGFALSPDGKTLAVHDTAQYRIVLLQVDGGGTPFTLVSEDLRIDLVQPAWSPDGKAVALAHQALITDGDTLDDTSEIYVVNADGSGLTAVPNVTGAYSVSWRPE